MLRLTKKSLIMMYAYHSSDTLFSTPRLVQTSSVLTSPPTDSLQMRNTKCNIMCKPLTRRRPTLSSFKAVCQKINLHNAHHQTMIKKVLHITRRSLQMRNPLKVVKLHTNNFSQNPTFSCSSYYRTS